MHILEKLVGVMAPHVCVGCGVEENRLICEGCQQSLIPVPSRCYRCKAVTDNYAVCQMCAPNSPLRQVVVYTRHTGLAKELIHRMKYERARGGMAEAAAFMSEQLVYLPAAVIFTHVPTATSRVRARGYDHAAEMARLVTAGSGSAAHTLLARVGQAHQVGANRTARLKQLQAAFRPVRPAHIRGRHVVLVDDVLTTGATLESAARVLKRAGAKRVSAIVFAQA